MNVVATILALIYAAVSYGLLGGIFLYDDLILKTNNVFLLSQLANLCRQQLAWCKQYSSVQNFFQ